MNRKTFFKKLFIGAAAIVVAPKIIVEVSQPSMGTCGIIPYLQREGRRMSFDKRTMLQPGDVITTGHEEGIVREGPNGSLIADLYPIIQEQQFAWMRIQSEIETVNFLIP